MNRTELKARLKAWERDFALREGRQAKKEDIRADPVIYKYYKDYDSGRRGADTKREVAVVAGNGFAGSSRSTRRPAGKGKEPPDTPTPHSSSRPSSSSVKCSEADDLFGSHYPLPTVGKSAARTPSKTAHVESLAGQDIGSSAAPSRPRLQDTPKTARRLFGDVKEKSNGFMPYQSPQKLKKLILDISKSQSPTRSPLAEARRASKRSDESPPKPKAGSSKVDLSPLPKGVRQSIERRSSRYEDSLQQLKTPQKPKEKEAQSFATIDPTPVNPERRGGKAFRALLKTPNKANTGLSDAVTSTKADPLADSTTQQAKDNSPPTRKNDGPTASSPWKKRRTVENSGLEDGAAAKPASNPFAKRALDRTISAPAKASTSPIHSHKRLRSVSTFWENDQAEDPTEAGEGSERADEEEGIGGLDGFDPFLLTNESTFRIPSFGTQALGPDLLRDPGDRLVDDSEDEEDNEDVNLFDERPDADIVNGMSRGVTMGMDDV